MFILDFRSRDLKSFVKIAIFSRAAARSEDFHSSPVFFQLPNHPLYSKVDWARVKAGEHAVVDPFDPHSILYLTEREYKIQVRVSMTQEHRLAVLATAGSSPVTGSDSAPQGGGPTGSGLGKQRVVLSSSSQLFEGLLPELEADLLSGSEKPEILPTLENLGRVFGAWYTRIAFWASGTTRLVSKTSKGHVKEAHLTFFVQHMLRILSTQGPKGLVVRMKAGLLLMNKAFPKDPETKLDPWVTSVGIKVNRKGFPLFLHPTVRNKLMTGDVTTFRIWASLLNTYKVFSFDSQTTLESITSPPISRPDETMETQMAFFAEHVFWPRVLKKSMPSPVMTEKEIRKAMPEREVFFFTAGPNLSVSSLGIWKDLAAWHFMSYCDVKTSTLWQYCKEFSLSSLMGEISRGLKILEDYGITAKSRDHRSAAVSMPESWLSMTKFARSSPSERERMEEARRHTPVFLGKIHAIPEAAGKVRIVAMVDSLSQRALLPLHDWMNSILRKLSCDATFDQDGSLKGYTSRGLEYQACYDLKSATDRIPEGLYRTVFSASPLGPSRTEAWLSLLIDRSYHVSDHAMAYIKPSSLSSRFVEYSTGQPMGALSSWPSMAIVHHFLVQYAAWKSGELSGELSSPNFPLFDKYLILGDDVVIGSRKTAKEYLHSMEVLGVTISLSKTYESTKGLVNFANQTFIGEENVSPLSIREALQVRGLAGAFALGARALTRGFLANPNAEKTSIHTSQVKARSAQTEVVRRMPNWTPPSLLRLLVGPAAWLTKVVPVIGNGRLSPPMRLGMLAWFYPSTVYKTALGFENYSYAALAWVLTTHTPRLMKVRDTLLKGDYPDALDREQFLYALRELLRWLSRSVDLEVSTVLDQYSCLESLCDQLPMSMRQWTSIFWGKQIDESLDSALDAQIDMRRVLSYIENPVKTIYVQIGPNRVCLQKGGEGLDEEILVQYILSLLAKLKPLPSFESVKTFIGSGKKLKLDPTARSYAIFNSLLRGLALVDHANSRELFTGRSALVGVAGS